MRVAAWIGVGLLIAGCAIDREGAFAGGAGTDTGRIPRDAGPGGRDGGRRDAGTAMDAEPPPAIDGGTAELDAGREVDAGMPEPDTGPPAPVDPEWGMPVALGSTVDARRCETDPALTSDGRWLFVTRPEALDAPCYENRRFHVFAWNDGTPVHRGILPRFDARFGETNHHPVVAGGGRYDFYHQATEPMNDTDLRMATISGDPPVSVITPSMRVSASSSGEDYGPSLTPAGTRMVFNRDADFVEAVLVAPGDWDVVRTHTSLASPESQGDAALSADALLMVFMRREGAGDNHDLWWTRRDSVDEQFGAPTRLPAPINSPQAEMDSYLTAEGDLLYVSARGDGTTRRVYLARRVR